MANGLGPLPALPPSQPSGDEEQRALIEAILRARPDAARQRTALLRYEAGGAQRPQFSGSAAGNIAGIAQSFLGALNQKRALTDYEGAAGAPDPAVQAILKAYGQGPEGEAPDQALGRQERVGRLAQLAPGMADFGQGIVQDVAGQRAAQAAAAQRQAQAAAKAEADRIAQDRWERDYGEKKRHNLAVESRPPTPWLIQTGTGPMMVDPRRPGAAQPIVGPEGPLAPPPTKPGRPPPRLQTHDKDLLDSLTGEINALGNLESSFRPDFAGQGPIGGVATQGMQILGSAGSKGMQKQAAFWSDFSRLIDLPQRNKVFGASLSAGEKSSWEGAKNIKPGTDPEIVKAKLAEMKGILSTKLGNIGASLAEEGYDPEAIAKRTGGLTAQPPGAQAAPRGQRAKAKDGRWYVQTPEGWDLDSDQGEE